MKEHSERTDPEYRTTKRSFLAGAGAGLAGLDVVGRLAGSPAPEMAGAAAGRTEVSPATAMSPAEVSAAYDRLREQYGPEAARRTFPLEAAERGGGSADRQRTDPGQSGTGGFRIETTDAPTNGPGSGFLENVRLVDSWHHAYDVHADWTGVLLAETDHFLNLYEADSRDALGKRILIWRSHNYSEAADEWWYSATTDRIDAHLDAGIDELEVVQFQPSTKVSFDGSDSWMEISAGPARVGTEFGADEGYQQPDPDRIQFGRGGEFAYEVGGRIPGLTTGSMIVDTRTESAWRFGWNTYVRASSGI